MEVSNLDFNVISFLKIKFFFQSNEKIGKMSKLVPSMIDRTIEIFIIDVLSELITIGQKKNIKIKLKHLKYLIKKKKRFRKTFQE
jgi:hypothetical protein